MFYLTLPSNSSMDYYPDNTLTTYTTKLSQPLELEGEWEVGLAEIQYPRSWYNVLKGEEVFCLAIKNIPETKPILSKVKIRHYSSVAKLVKEFEKDMTNDSEKTVFLLRVKPGYYSDITKIIDKLEKTIKVNTDERSIKFTYDEVSHKVKMVLKNDFEIYMSPEFQRILGFNQMGFTVGTHTGKHVVDVHRGCYSLYVYCPLIQPRMVGDAVVPLLREIAIEGEMGQVMTKTYEKIHYIPLQQKRFETIEIYIRDDTGKPIRFEWGKVVVTLCFRRRDLKYL